MKIRAGKLFVVIAASSVFACGAFANRVKLENKWATSDYKYYDDPQHPTMVQCYADEKMGPAIAAATSDEAVAAVAGDAEKMRELLAKVATNYSTDPVAACQIAAVSVWVMENAGKPWYAFWRSSREDERSGWVDALLSAANASNDEYVVSYLLDQVRWCGSPADAQRVREIGAAKSSFVHIREVTALVADELQSR